MKDTPITNGYSSEYRSFTDFKENQKQLPANYKYNGSPNSNGLPQQTRNQSSPPNSYSQSHILSGMAENTVYGNGNSSPMQVVGNLSANSTRMSKTLKRSASTVSDIQYMRGGRGAPISMGKQYTYIHTHTHTHIYIISNTIFSLIGLLSK